MHELIITGCFTTGTTCEDPEKAKAMCLRLLEKQLTDAQCAGTNGLFTFKVLFMSVERIK